MPLEVRESKAGPATVLALKGNMVIGKETEALAARIQALIDGGVTPVILDMGEVGYVDSSGISVLIRSHISAGRRSASVKLARLTKRVQEVLEITRLDSVLDVHEDLEKAIAAFNPQASGAKPPA